MKICAVICEYNPFHNGHEYHLKSARVQSEADAILCIMSGDFVQRAQPAIVNKYIRTNAALHGGADAVIELPTVFATANGQRFAEGAIKILDGMNVTHLAFGCENNDLALLKQIAEIQLIEDAQFKQTLRQSLNDGNSYASSYSFATQKALDNCSNGSVMYDIVLKMPNNLLAIEYLKALSRLNSNIQPVAISRVGGGYNSLETNNQYISATAARELLQSGNNTMLANHIPHTSFLPLITEYGNHCINYEIYNALTINAIRNTPPINLPEDSEGLLNKLIQNAEKCCDFDSILTQTKSKRYTLSRIKRLCLQLLLGISNDVYNCMDIYNKAKTISARLLGFNSRSKHIISALSNNLLTTNNQLNSVNNYQKTIMDIDKKASNIYSLITRKNGFQYYENKIITI